MAKLEDLKLVRDDESLNIYFDLGEDVEPYHVCYWHEDEWVEDAEGVVMSMLVAMELFYTDKQGLLDKLGININDI